MSPRALSDPEQPSFEAGQWPSVARIWHQLGSPLRPVEADLAFCRAALADWVAEAGGRPPRALILGVTPELYRLPWPEGSIIRAADRTEAMIRCVWPGEPAQVLQADWRRLDWPPASFDLVLCDGGLHLLDHPRGQGELVAGLARLLAPGGACVFRLFVPPAAPESPEAVLAALFAGAIPDLNCLKLRLGMALQAGPTEGVALQEVWQRLHAAAGDWPGLAARLGWPLDHLLAIEAYRASPACYHFVSAAEAEALFCGGPDPAFQLLRADTAAYPMGAQCPTLVFRRTVPGVEADHGA